MNINIKNYLKEAGLSESEGSAYKIIAFSKTLYHGSPKDVKKFEVGNGAGRYGKGLYLTPELSVAQFYAAGGRQGNAGQKLKNGSGFLYQFEVKGKALVVYDEYETMSDMQSDIEEAEEAFSQGGDLTSSKVTQYLGQWADEYHGCGIVWLNEKDAGVMSPLNQVLITDKSAIKSMKAIK